MVRVTRCLVSAVLCGAWVFSAAASPVEDAGRAYDRGDYSLAADLYERAAEQTPALKDDKAFVTAWRKAEARVAYATGSRLHKEGEYGAAADQFMRAIGKDSDFELAYAALADAQQAGIRQHLLAAVEAADNGDLLTAKNRLERSLVLGGGSNDQVTTAINSIAKPEETFDKKTLDKLAEAKRLGKDRQWGLAEQQLTELVKQTPLMLPARAELSRAQRYKNMSVAMTDEAAALITQKRLSPALAKLSSATSVWPYNQRAAELLESVEAQVKRAAALVDEARKLSEQADWRGANEKLVDALAIDPSHADARALRSKVRVGLVKMLGEQAQAELDEGNVARARELLDRADQYWANNRWTRTGFSAYQLVLMQQAEEAGRTGEAYLRALLASRQDEATFRIPQMERAMLREAGATYSYKIDSTTPAIGVDSGALATALSAQAYATHRSPLTCTAIVHGALAIEPGADAPDKAEPRYTVRVVITETDVDLRQRSNGLTTHIGTTFGDTSIAGHTHYWEKYGYVDAQVQVFDNQTGERVDSWSAHRWANYTDRQQYVVGRSWNTSYWTLPTDDAIESRLANDLSEAIQTAVDESIALARARALRDAADELEKDNPSAALDQRVAAVVLAGQVNTRQARQELRRMARDLDKQHPTGMPKPAESE